MYTTSLILAFLMPKMSTIKRFLTVACFIQGTVGQNEAVYQRGLYCRRLFTPAINSAMGLCTFPCLLLSHEQPPKILVQWEPDGTICKIYERFSQELKTGLCRRGLCHGTPSYGGIKRIKRDLRSSIASSQRSNNYAVYTHLNRTAGAANAATFRQRIERRRRQMWFDCQCASQRRLFGDTSLLSRSFGRGSRGRREKRRKVGCGIICMFLINRYKHDKNWASLFQARSNSFGSGGIANATVTSGGNQSFHGLTSGPTGGSSSRLNVPGIRSTSHASGIHSAGIIGSGGVGITNHLAAGSGGVSVNNAATSGRGTGAGTGAGGGSDTVVGIGTVNNAASRNLTAGTSVGNVSPTISSISGIAREGNRPVGGDTTGSPILVTGGPPDSGRRGISNSGASGGGVGGMPLETGSVGSVGITGGSSTIVGINSAAAGGAPNSLAAGGLSGSSASGAAGSGSNNGIILSSTGLPGSNTHVPGGASVESGGGVSNTAVAVVGSGPGPVVNTASLTGSRLGINNGRLSNENHGSNAIAGTETSGVTAGGTVSTDGAGPGISSSGSSRGVAASGAPTFPGSVGTMNARGGGIAIGAGVGSNDRVIGNGGRTNVHGDERGTRASGGTVIVTGIGGSGTSPASSTGNSGMETISTTLSSAGSRESATTATESRRVLTVVSPGGVDHGVRGTLGEGGESNGAAASSTGISPGSTGRGAVLSGTNGTSNSVSSSTVLSGGTGAGGRHAGTGVHSVGNGRIGIGSNTFSPESAGVPNSSTAAGRGATGTSLVGSSVGVLHGSGAPSGSTLTPGNNASPTGTITPSVVTGNVSLGNEAAGIDSVGNHGTDTTNTGLPNESASSSVRNVVGSGAGPSNVGVGGVITAGSTGGGATSAVAGHARSASEEVRIGFLSNPGSDMGNSGSTGGSASVPHTTSVERGAGEGNMAVGGNNIPAPTGTPGSSGLGPVRGGVSNGSAGSPGVTALAGGGMNSAITGHEEGISAGFSNNRGIATPTHLSTSGGASSAALTGLRGTGTEGGGGSNTLGMTSRGVTGTDTAVRNNSGVETGTASVSSSNASITANVPGSSSLPSGIDNVPVVGGGNSAAVGATGSSSSIVVGHASGVTTSTATFGGGLTGLPVAAPAVAVVGTGAGEPRASVSGTVSGGGAGVGGGFLGSASGITNSALSDERTRTILSSGVPGAGIGSDSNNGGREVGAHATGSAARTLTNGDLSGGSSGRFSILGPGRHDGSSGTHDSSYGAGIGGGGGLGPGSFTNGAPFRFGGPNGGTASGFVNTGGGMSGGAWNALSGAYNGMGIGYGSNRFPGAFGSMAGMQPYGGRNFGTGGVNPGSLPPRRNIELYEDDIFFQD